MKSIYSFCVRVLISGVLCFSAVPVMSEDSNGYIPVGGYEYVALDSQAVQSPGVGTIFLGANSTFSGIYKYNELSEKTPQGYPETFHTIDIMFEAHTDRHQIVSSFLSESDQPVAGGLATFQAAAIYIYQLLKNEELTLSLGLGAAVGDFGIDRKDGKPWPLIPVPFIRMEYNSDIIEGEFSFVSGPSLYFTVFPERRFRFSGMMSMDEFRDFRDLIFDASLQYRFFAEDDSKNDFAGISAGVRNSKLRCTPGGFDDTYEIQYYSVFSELDLSFLKISSGYAFGGRERIGEAQPIKSGEGYFLSLQAMYQFGGDENDK